MYRWLLVFLLLVVACSSEPSIQDTSDCSKMPGHYQNECCYNRDSTYCPSIHEDAYWDGETCGCAENEKAAQGKKVDTCSLVAENLRDSCCADKVACREGQIAQYDNGCACADIPEVPCNEVDLSEADACCARSQVCDPGKEAKYDQGSQQCGCKEDELASQCEALECGDKQISFDLALGKCVCK